MKNIFLCMLIMMACDTYSRGLNNSDSTILIGNAPFLNEGDTVTLIVNKYGNFIDKELLATYTTTIKNGTYKFSVKLFVPAYFSLQLSKKNIKLNILHYLIEPGDSILIARIDNDSIQLSGKGSDRLRVQIENKKIRLESFKKIGGWDTLKIKRTFAIRDSSAIKEIEHLRANKKILGDTLYTILLADIVGESGLKIDYFLNYNSPPIVEIWRRTLRDYKDNVWKKYNLFSPNNNWLKYSYTYANAIIAKYKWDSCVMVEKSFSATRCYEYIRKNYKGSLREKIVTTLLYETRKQGEDISNCLRSSLSYVVNKDFKRILQNLQTGLTKGSSAFKFNLPDTSGIMHDYTEFKGKVILLDFWFTGCAACRQIKPKMDSIAHLFKNNNIVFITISIDKNKDQWKSSIRKNIYTSEHNINLYTEGKGDDHPIISYYLIGSYPELILIDKKGKLCDKPIDPRIDNGKNLIDLIDKSLKL
jgi:thiol-disulfide isomerase/thioredoxin